MSGKVSLNSVQLKNVSRNAGQPGLVRISAARPPMTTTVETAAIANPRRSRARRAAARSARRSELPAPLSVLGATRAPAPWSACRSSSCWIFSSWPLDLSSSIAADTQSVSDEFLASSAPHLSPPGAGNGADDLAVGHLHRGQVEGGRHIDHDRVDLALLERLDDVVGVLEDARLRRRVDLGLHGLEARGADLHADRRVLEVVERGRVGEVGALRRDDRLVGLVVGRGEIDCLGALWRDRDLVDVEVEVLRPRRVGGVERLGHPVHLVGAEAELVGDRVGDGALEALAVRRVVVLEVRRVGRLVGGDGERPALERVERVGLTVGERDVDEAVVPVELVLLPPPQPAAITSSAPSASSMDRGSRRLRTGDLVRFASAGRGGNPTRRRGAPPAGPARG